MHQKLRKCLENIVPIAAGFVRDMKKYYVDVFQSEHGHCDEVEKTGAAATGFR